MSPRMSRRKSGCFSSTVTGTPARASSSPSIIPAGPPPTIAHVVLVIPTARDVGAGSRLRRHAIRPISRVTGPTRR